MMGKTVHPGYEFEAERGERKSQERLTIFRSLEINL